MTVTWKEALTEKQLQRKKQLKSKRAQERKRLKRNLKRKMGCVITGCEHKVIKKMKWTSKFLPIEQKFASFKKEFPNGITQKKLLNLGEKKFVKFFYDYGVCVCVKHWQEFKQRQETENALYGLLEDEHQHLIEEGLEEGDE